MATPTLDTHRPAATSRETRFRLRYATVRRAASYIMLLTMMLVVTLVAGTYQGYRAAMQRGRDSLPPSALVSTAFGDIEYVDRGDGPAVLVVHGAGGGYDQGLLIGQTFVGDGYRLIAPSRFGYPGSPIPEDGSPVAQADAYAALLDSLGIQAVAMVAYSDGGPSALQFALRHPHRTTALVMMAAKSQTPPSATFPQEAVFEAIFRSDYLYWAVSTAARPFLLEALGVSSEVQAEATGSARELITAVTDGMNPIGLRSDGIYHDRATLNVLPADTFPLEQIRVPTLVVHAKDDGLQPFTHALNTASRVPGAQLVANDRGGHLLSLQTEDAAEKIRAFLSGHLASRIGQ